MKKQLLIASGLILALVLIYISWGPQIFPSSNSSTTEPTISQTTPIPSPTYAPDSINQYDIKLTAKTADQTAFDLLKSKADVKAKQYDFGVFIQSINDVAGDDKHYWAFYLNGEYAQSGADQTLLKPGDTIEFKYEEIKNDFGS